MSFSPTIANTADECGIRAFGVVQSSLAALPALRRQPGPVIGEPIPASLLKHADEQTVAGLAAVAHAVRDFGLAGQSFAQWGVLGAPCFPGRVCAAAAVSQFLEEGALGVSPHIIPHRSTHSLSGTISLAFQMRGPNYGVGGAPGAVVEGLLAALALVVEERPPGLWLVLTEWDPEPLPNGNGPSAEEAICRAVALALVPEATAEDVLRLRLVPAAVNEAGTAATVAGLADFLKGTATGGGRHWRCPLDWGGTLELAPARPPCTLVGARS